jgi:hypothetical protein
MFQCSWRKEVAEMQKRGTLKRLPKPRWMTECDVIRYGLQIPEDLKAHMKKEALEKGMDMSSYICGLLSGDIKRKRGKK